MNKFRQWKQRLLFVSILLFISLAACSHRRYVREPFAGFTAPPAIQQTAVVDPVAAASALLKPHNKTVIVIDPGHGGRDYGTYSKKAPRYQEKHLNLTTAYMLKNFLQQYGYTVKMTRSNDVFISLEKRAEMANELKPRLFVSLHYNSAPNREAEGIEVYYYRSKDDFKRSTSSRKLAQSINRQIISTTEAKSRGVKHGDLSVIRETKMPAVLVEGGFLTNENEVTKLKSAVYLKRIAWGVAQGIHEYLEQNPVEAVASKG